MTFTFLILGFLFGLQHAFDADHIAAVSVLTAKSGTRREALSKGIFWGLGHTVTLLLVGFFTLAFGLAIPKTWSAFFEIAIAIILMVFGTFVFIDFWKSRKNDWHSHLPFGLHRHPHTSFFIGMLHGLAGSAAIFIILISATKSALLGLLSILIFGLGSMLGMAIFSFAISLSALKFKKYTGLAAGVFSLSTGLALFFAQMF